MVSAREKTNAQLVTEFNVARARTDTIADELASSIRPTTRRPNVEELTVSIATITRRSRRSRDAAAKNDPKAANAATKTLIKQSRALNTAQNKVAADTGAARGRQLARPLREPTLDGSILSSSVWSGRSRRSSSLSTV